MSFTGITWLKDIWSWARENDIPNWVAIAVSSIVWPVMLILWQRRKVNGVRGLDVHFSRSEIEINGKRHSAVDIEFTNHTGAVVYISGAYIRDCTKSFYVPADAARDVAGNSYNLKFFDGSTFAMREVTLQTNRAAKTSMASRVLENEFFHHSPNPLRRLIRRPKYFVLEYTVMVGSVRHLVATLY